MESIGKYINSVYEINNYIIKRTFITKGIQL